MLKRTAKHNGTSYTLEVSSIVYNVKYILYPFGDSIHITTPYIENNDNTIENTMRLTVDQIHSLPKTVKIKLGLIQKYRIRKQIGNHIRFLMKDYNWGTYAEAATFENEKAAKTFLRKTKIDDFVYIDYDNLRENFSDAFIVCKKIGDETLFMSNDLQKAKAKAENIFPTHENHVFWKTTGTKFYA